METQTAVTCSAVVDNCPTKSTLEAATLVSDAALRDACLLNPNHDRIAPAVKTASDVKNDLAKSQSGTVKLLDALAKACSLGKLEVGTEFALKKLAECEAAPANAKIIAADVLDRLAKKRVPVAACLVAALRRHKGEEALVAPKAGVATPK